MKNDFKIQLSKDDLLDIVYAGFLLMTKPWHPEIHNSDKMLFEIGSIPIDISYSRSTKQYTLTFRNEPPESNALNDDDD